jgi:hypothetical protein
METSRNEKPSGRITEARARAQRAKLDLLDEYPRQGNEQPTRQSQPKKKPTPKDLATRRRARTTVTVAMENYLADHEGGNASVKTLEWHRNALTQLSQFLATERNITLVCEIDAPDISAWFTHLRKTPGGRGKMRCERTIQTYARSARAFCHWMVRQEVMEYQSAMLYPVRVCHFDDG